MACFVLSGCYSLIFVSRLLFFPVGKCFRCVQVLLNKMKWCCSLAVFLRFSVRSIRGERPASDSLERVKRIQRLCSFCSIARASTVCVRVVRAWMEANFTQTWNTHRQSFVFSGEPGVFGWFRSGYLWAIRFRLKICRVIVVPKLSEYQDRDPIQTHNFHQLIAVLRIINNLLVSWPWSSY